MSSIARRIRAVGAVSLIWCAAYAVVGVLLGLWKWLDRPADAHPAYSVLAWVLGSAVPIAVLGALCGAGFAVLLARAERHHAIDDLRAWRITLWGALASGAGLVAYLGLRGSLLVWASHVGPFAVYLGIVATLGGLASFGSLAIARRASLPIPAGRREIAAT